MTLVEVVRDDKVLAVPEVSSLNWLVINSRHVVFIQILPLNFLSTGRVFGLASSSAAFELVKTIQYKLVTRANGDSRFLKRGCETAVSRLESPVAVPGSCEFQSKPHSKKRRLSSRRDRSFRWNLRFLGFRILRQVLEGAA